MENLPASQIQGCMLAMSATLEVKAKGQLGSMGLNLLARPPKLILLTQRLLCGWSFRNGGRLFCCLGSFCCCCLAGYFFMLFVCFALAGSSYLAQGGFDLRMVLPQPPRPEIVGMPHGTMLLPYSFEPISDFEGIRLFPFPRFLIVSLAVTSLVRA